MTFLASVCGWLDASIKDVPIEMSVATHTLPGPRR
jgi:hypothetical protein